MPHFRGHLSILMGGNVFILYLNNNQWNLAILTHDQKLVWVSSKNDGYGSPANCLDFWAWDNLTDGINFIILSKTEQHPVQRHAHMDSQSAVCCRHFWGATTHLGQALLEDLKAEDHGGRQRPAVVTVRAKPGKTVREDRAGEEAECHNKVLILSNEDVISSASCHISNLCFKPNFSKQRSSTTCKTEQHFKPHWK